jgi:hypothetical protein
MILGWPLPKLCPVIPTSNQDGRQEIGSVVSEEKIFFKFHPLLFLICIIGQNSICSNSGHLEWRVGLSDTILKGTHTGTIPASARFGLIWFSGFRGEDLNVIFPTSNQDGRQAQNRKKGG